MEISFISSTPKGNIFVNGYFRLCSACVHGLASCSFIPTLVISFNDDLWSLLRLNFAAFPPEDSAPEPFSTQGTDCVMWPAVLKESIKPEKAHT